MYKRERIKGFEEYEVDTEGIVYSKIQIYKFKKISQKPLDKERDLCYNRDTVT